MRLRHAVALVLAVVVLSAAPAAFACQAAGPNAHIGTVTAIDSEKKTLSLKDAESGMALTFVTTPELLKGVKVKDEVTVVYKSEGKTLRATSIKKG